MRWFFVLIALNITAAAQPGKSQPDTLSLPQVQEIQSRDLWFGKDKFDHFSSSAFLTGLGYYAARSEMSLSSPASHNVAVAFSVGIGVGKEIYDKISGRGHPSCKDLLADFLGTALAVSILHLSTQ